MKMICKLKSRAGFSLAETLLAVLILLMVSTIVATGIPVAQNAYNKVVLAADAQSLLSTTISALRNELGTANDVSVSDKTITYLSARTSAYSQIYLDGDVIMLQEYVGVPDGVPLIGAVVAESVDTSRRLVSTGSAPSGMYVVYGGAAIANNVLTISNLEVKKGTTVITSLPSLQIRVFSTYKPKN